MVTRAVSSVWYRLADRPRSSLTTAKPSLLASGRISMRGPPKTSSRAARKAAGAGLGSGTRASRSRAVSSAVSRPRWVHSAKDQKTTPPPTSRWLSTMGNSRLLLG